jgi:hypothetical protein
VRLFETPSELAALVSVVGLLASAVYYLASVKFQFEVLGIKMDSQHKELLNEIDMRFNAVDAKLGTHSTQMQEVGASLAGATAAAGRPSGMLSSACVWLICVFSLAPLCVPANSSPAVCRCAGMPPASHKPSMP